MSIKNRSGLAWKAFAKLSFSPAWFRFSSPVVPILKKKNRADAKYTEEKTKTMQEYKSCVKKAKQDHDKLDACERLLKAIE